MSLLSRLKGLLQINRLERDLDEKPRSHVETRTANNAAAGMEAREARYDAQRRLGNTGVVVAAVGVARKNRPSVATNERLELSSRR
jgi:hypothetical protein